MTPRVELRLLRSAVFTTVCVALTVAGHEVEGGHPVAPVAVVVGLAVVFAAAVAAGGRERSATAIMAAMFAGQVGLHLLFSHVGGAMPGMDADAAVAAPGMVAVHAVVAVLSGWWLSRGEAACWRRVRRAESATVAALRAALAHLARDPLALSDGCVPRPPTPRGVEPGRAMTLLRARCEPRRGPPCAPAAAPVRA